MNRPVRIALTLFISATILIFLVNRRLQALPKITPGDRFQSDAEMDRIHSEVIMINVGMVLVGAMLVAGFALIITAIIRARKKPAADG